MGLLIPTIAIACAGLLLIGASLNRGLDWSDEAFVLAMTASGRIAVDEAWGFQHLLQGLYVTLGEQVLSMRVVRLAGYLLLSGLLTSAAAATLRRWGITLSGREQLFVLAVGQAGTFAAYSYAYRSVGYNDLSSWIAQVVGALIVLAVAPAGVNPRWWSAYPWVLAGLLVPVLLVAKFTAGVSVAGILLLALLLPAQAVPLVRRIIAVLLGAGLAGVALVALGVPVREVVDNSLAMILDDAVAADSDHSIPSILRNYLDSLAVTVLNLVPPAAALLLVVLVSRRRDPRRPWRTLTAWAGAAGLGVALVIPLLRLRSWDALGVLVAFLGLGALLVALAGHHGWIGRLPNKADRLRALGSILVIVAVPIASVVGTNNPIFGQLTFSATTWAVALGVAVVAFSRSVDSSQRDVPLMVGLAVVTILAAAVATDVFDHPYRTEPYFSQRTATTAPILAGLRMTEGEARLADWLTHTAREVGAGDVPAVALESPGHVLVFNSSGWATPWVGQNWARSIEAACRDGAPTDLFVIEPGSAVGLQGDGRDGERLTAALTVCGIAYPEDFSAVGTGPDGTVVMQLTEPTA